MTKPGNQAIREAVGIFLNAKHLHEAINDLIESGFKRSQLGLLAAEGTVQEALGDFYVSTNKSMDDDKAPVTAFVRKESVGDTVHDLEGALVFAGTTAAGAVAVASAAIFGGALAAVIAGVAGVGAIGAAMGFVIHQSDAEYLEQQVDEGHLLLFVHVLDPHREQLAIEILKRHCAYEPRIHEVVLGKKGSAHIVDTNPA